MPAMGFQVGSTCYPTADAAVAASVALVPGSVVPFGSGSAVLDVQSITSTGATYVATPLAGGSAVALTVPITVVPCQLPGAQEAVQVGWMVGAAWIAVYAVIAIARYINVEILHLGASANDA